MDMMLLGVPPRILQQIEHGKAFRLARLPKALPGGNPGFRKPGAREMRLVEAHDERMEKEILPRRRGHRGIIFFANGIGLGFLGHGVLSTTHFS